MKWAITSVVLLTACYQNNNRDITIEEAVYQDIDHFLIKTQTATYYYDKEGGGFSRIIDRDGNDWIGFVSDSVSSYPASAASSYRGLPNLIFGGEDNGAGHPGFDQCRSEKVSNNTIRSESLSGKWEWEWSFFDSYTKMELVTMDSGRHYWFLYEGPAGGKFEPDNYYWGHNQEGPLHYMPDYHSGERSTGNWNWIYFGIRNNNNVFFIAQDSTDENDDMFAVLGNSQEGLASGDGMMVAGFGRRKPAEPLMGKLNTFFIGFIKRKNASANIHSQVSGSIKKIVNR